MSKNVSAAIILILVLAVVIAGVYFIFRDRSEPAQDTQKNDEAKNTGKVEMIQGMKVEILNEGAGRQAAPGDTVFVHYTGTLESGTKFDSSLDRGEPFLFTLGENRVIKGWEFGILGMRPGEKRRLTIPPELAYGQRGMGSAIPPNSTLIFEVEMVKIDSPVELE